MAARYKVVTTDSVDSGFKYISGWSAQEVNGTPAATVVYLREGGAGGDKVVRIELAANETANMSYDTPIMFSNNCFVDMVAAGDAEITVFGW